MIPKGVNRLILYPEAAGLRKIKERMIGKLVMVPASLETMAWRLLCRTVGCNRCSEPANII